jgi:hypothetical protein
VRPTERSGAVVLYGDIARNPSILAVDDEQLILVRYSKFTHSFNDETCGFQRPTVDVRFRETASIAGVKRRPRALMARP